MGDKTAIPQDVLNAATAAAEPVVAAQCSDAKPVAVYYMAWSGCGATQTHIIAEQIAKEYGVPLQYFSFEEQIQGFPPGLFGNYDSLPGEQTSIDPRKYGLTEPGPEVVIVDENGKVSIVESLDEAKQCHSGMTVSDVVPAVRSSGAGRYA